MDVPSDLDGSCNSNVCEVKRRSKLSRDPVLKVDRKGGDWKIIDRKDKSSDNLLDTCLAECSIDFDDPKSVDSYLQRATPFLKMLLYIRKPIVKYQQSKGIPINCMFTFSTLLSTFYENTSTVLCAITMLLYNLTPLFDMGLYVLRFIIDKIIDISNTDDGYDLIMKIFIFTFEALFMLLLLIITVLIVVIPILSLVGHVLLQAIKIIT